MAETAHYTQQVDLTLLKLNGRQEIADENPSTLSKYNMGSFLKEVAEMIEHFGLQTFFYLKDSSVKMKCLPDKPRNFMLESITTEHSFRLMEPKVVMNKSGDENLASVLARFRCYNLYEQCDFSLSHLAIEALTHPDLQAQVIVQYGEVKSFKYLPEKIIL